MTLSRRDFTRLTAGAGALATLTQLGRSASVAQTASPYRAMVGVFLFGGNDGWNMVVPADGRYAAYAAQRGAPLALKREAVTALPGSNYALHPSLAPLRAAWNEGALSVVLNTGSLFTPLNKALYTARPDLRPLNLMSHADEQAHWQGVRVRGVSLDGFMGRMADRAAPSAILPPTVSFAGSNLILYGQSSSPLVLSSQGTLVRNGYNAAATDAATTSRQAALAAFASGQGYGGVTERTATGISSAYAQAVAANAIVAAPTSAVDVHFRNPVTGAALTSDIARQLQRVARMIEARGGLGQNRQTFFVSQGGYDTHANQVDAGNTATGTQANLFADLGMALAAFYNATKAMGVSREVTTFTMADFGRTFQGNASRGTDHAWGNNHLVMGGALRPNLVHGAYPDMTFGGPSDISNNGRWIPSLSIEEYVGSIVSWSGVPDADMPYVFPNWAAWSSGGRGPLALFGSAPTAPTGTAPLPTPTPESGPPTPGVRMDLS